MPRAPIDLHEPRDLRFRSDLEREGDGARLGPKGYVRSDERIFEDACELIASRDDVDSTDVTVIVQEGEIVLEGTVATRHEKVLLERLLDHVRGVVDIHNRLRIRIPREWEPRLDASGRPIPRRIM